MSRVRISGASDDLIEIEGTVPGCDEYNTEPGSFHVAGLQIGVEYIRGGTWQIAVARVDEDVPVTASDIRLFEEGYTMVLDMEVPAGAYVTRIGGPS